MTEDPEYDGGSSVLEYLVTMKGDTCGSRDVYRGHDTQCTVASLLPGRLYSFQVKANNKAGVRMSTELSLCFLQCLVVRYSDPVGAGMGDHLQPYKPSHCVTIHQGQLNLVTPSWIGTVSTIESWGMNDSQAPHPWSRSMI